MFEKEIAKGMAWLDETMPGWWKKIDLNILDLRNPCKCVLGQVFASDAEMFCGYMTGYGYARRFFEYVGPDFCYRPYHPSELGFNLRVIDGKFWSELQGRNPWKILDQEWIEAIRQRQQEDVVVDEPELELCEVGA